MTVTRTIIPLGLPGDEWIVLVPSAGKVYVVTFPTEPVNQTPGQMVSKPPCGVLCPPSVKMSQKARDWCILWCSKTFSEQMGYIYQTCLGWTMVNSGCNYSKGWSCVGRHSQLVNPVLHCKTNKTMLLPELLKLCHDYKWQRYALTQEFKNCVPLTSLRRASAQTFT
jgi:hypothetical protein